MSVYSQALWGGGNRTLKARRDKLFYSLAFLKCVFSSKFFKFFSLLLPFTLATYTLNAVELDSLIANKLQSCGVLTFTQKELSKSLLVGLIEKEQSFTLTNLNNRDEVVEDIEKLLKNTQQKYQVKNGSSKVAKGVVGYFLGGVTGAFLGYFSDFTKSDIHWLILESPDSRILDVVFVKDLTKK